MARYDIFGKTEGMRRQVQDLILTAYRKGYKDGELDEQDRKLEMLLKEKKGKWIKEKALFQYQEITVWRCDQCGRLTNDWSDKYCSGCGARMEDEHMANLREYAQDFGVSIEQAEENLRKGDN